MTAFAILGLAYLLLFVLLLVPGAVVAYRRRSSSSFETRETAEPTALADVPLARITGPLPARDDRVLRVRGRIRVPEGVAVRSGLISDSELVCAAGSVLLGPVRCPRLRAGDGPSPPDVAAIGSARWTPRMDAALRDRWPSGTLEDIAAELNALPRVRVRGSQVLVRARELGLFARGLPARPALIGDGRAWPLAPDVVRVRGDLSVPAGASVSYTLVVEGSVDAGEEAVFEGGVRGTRGVTLGPRAVVHGTVASDRSVVIGAGACVRGPVEAGGHVVLLRGALVGVVGAAGVHALGRIELAPGAEIVGGAVAGLGVRITLGRDGS